MADSYYDITEVRFVIEPDATHVYMYAQPLDDCPIGIQGWHYKAFPVSMSTLDILQAWARGEETPILWPIKAPASAPAAKSGGRHYEFIAEAYDLLERHAKRTLAEHNPCDIRDGACRRGRMGGKSFCCDPCDNLEKDGSCRIDFLGCRAWLCAEALVALPEDVRRVYDDIQAALTAFRFRRYLDRPTLIKDSCMRARRI